jgi:hypothetical protein
VEANIYDAETAINQPASFDRVFISWGALCWLPDVHTWARIAASFLKPNGYLALADAHPVAYVFDDATSTPDGMPGWYAPYLARQPLRADRPEDYADPARPPEQQSDRPIPAPDRRRHRRPTQRRPPPRPVPGT